MAHSSPSHRFGQIVGNIFEDAILSYLSGIAEAHSVYFDYKHPRMARNGKKEVKWKDINGNEHKLDAVMERNGSEYEFGKPRAFVEIAWRRYVKHSKNKAQEISGAVRPLIARYQEHAPFFGAIVSGEFTQNALNQMRSEGFQVAFVPMSEVLEAFNAVGIDAHWSEKDDPAVLQNKISAYERLAEKDRERLKNRLVELSAKHLVEFEFCLTSSLSRKITRIGVFAMYGTESSFDCAKDACLYIASFAEAPSSALFSHIEISMSYSNGDRHTAKFAHRSDAIRFIQNYCQHWD